MVRFKSLVPEMAGTSPYRRRMETRVARDISDDYRGSLISPIACLVICVVFQK